MLRISIMKFFVIYLFLSVFEGYIAKAQIGSANVDVGSAGAEEDLTHLGCPPNEPNVPNVPVTAREEYCKCLKEQRKVNVNVGVIGISANASTPTIPCKNPNEGYILYVERGETSTILSNRGIVLKNPNQERHDKNDATQEITYETTIDADNPLWIYGTIIANDIPLYPIYQQRPINMCTDECEEGTWECILLKIWKLGLTEHGTCPQESATFHISQTLPPLRVTLPYYIPCGNYTIKSSADNSNKRWTIEVFWYFYVGYTSGCKEYPKD